MKSRGGCGAVAAHQHIHGVLHLQRAYLSADAAQRQGERSSRWNFDRLVGGTQHTAALFRAVVLSFRLMVVVERGCGLIGQLRPPGRRW